MGETEAQREVGVGDAGWRRPPPRWNNSDEFGSPWLLGHKELSSKNSVGWSQRPRMPEIVPKVATTEEVGG